MNRILIPWILLAFLSLPSGLPLTAPAFASLPPLTQHDVDISGEDDDADGDADADDDGGEDGDGGDF